MSWITLIWSMIASACLTLAGIYLVVWSTNRSALANLAFSLAALATAAFTFVELWMLRAETPQEFAMALRWLHPPMFLWVVSIVWFVRLYLRAGRTWLAWTVCGLRAFSLLLNFLVGQNLNYREITTLGHMTFLGESIAIPQGLPNPWMLVGQASIVLLLVFVADASVTAWRQGDRQRALTVGGTILFMLLAALADALLVFWGFVQSPLTVTLFQVCIVVAMGYELSRDVLRASQLAHELRESEERMSLAVDAADFGIWIRDLARNDIWANDKWRQLFGFTPSERLELERILQRVHPDDRDAVRQVLTTAIASRSKYEMEFRLMLPDGGIRWIASHGRVESDVKGQPVLIRGASRDCTHRKQADQEVLLLRREIAHAGRVSMMGQLASALAHEINQPLGAILRNAEAAELFLQNASPDLDEIRAMLADIRSDDQRAGAVIDRMHGLLKRHDLKTHPVDVGELVSEVVALVRVDALERRVKLVVDLPDGLLFVRGDRVHLQQVLLNLILNGMDAFHSDGQSAQTEDRRVAVIVRLTPMQTGARNVEIVVSDTGHGISADTLARVFDPFFTTKPNGMGMGLSISRTIIEAHGGRLWAENNGGSGAVFRFTLPAAEESASAWA